MSGIVSPNSGSGVIFASDGRIVDDEFGGVTEWDTVASVIYSNSDVLGIEDWTTDWWPAQGYTLDSSGMDDVKDPAYFQRVWTNGGSNGRLAFVGVTRDQYGSPVGGCTVRCFRAATCELVSTVTSDPNTGQYTATSPYLEAHFLTIHKSGTPNIAGASVDTVQPA